MRESLISFVEREIIREELDLSPWFSAEQIETIDRAAEADDSAQTFP